VLYVGEIQPHTIGPHPITKTTQTKTLRAAVRDIGVDIRVVAAGTCPYLEPTSIRIGTRKIWFKVVGEKRISVADSNQNRIRTQLVSLPVARCCRQKVFGTVGKKKRIPTAKERRRSASINTYIINIKNNTHGVVTCASLDPDYAARQGAFNRICYANFKGILTALQYQ
jgi:hypothetical protein